MMIEIGRRRFYIHNCGHHSFPNLPEDLNKEWTISKTKEALTILCNGVEALNLVYDEVDIYCTRTWSKSATKINFRNSDKASDYRRTLQRGKQ